jgi:hypothetical protein
MLVLMSPEALVRPDHPLRGIKKLADEALSELNDIFEAIYSDNGRLSIPPERLLKSMLLMALYTVRSERLSCEHEANRVSGLSPSSSPNRERGRGRGRGRKQDAKKAALQAAFSASC